MEGALVCCGNVHGEVQQLGAASRGDGRVQVPIVRVDEERKVGVGKDIGLVPGVPRGAHLAGEVRSRGESSLQGIRFVPVFGRTAQENFSIQR